MLGSSTRCARLGLALALALGVGAGTAHAEPYPFAPMTPAEPWWTWPVPSHARVRGPCRAWQTGGRGTSMVRFRYDDAGRLIEIDEDGATEVVRLEWGPQGLRKRIAYDPVRARAERVSELERDAAGRIVAEHHFRQTARGLVATDTTRFRYDEAGRLVAWTTFDGWSHTLTWQGSEPVLSQSTPPAGAAPTSSTRYTWEGGRLIMQTDFGAGAPRTWRYRYDGERLVEVQASEGDEGGFDGKLGYDCPDDPKASPPP